MLNTSASAKTQLHPRLAFEDDKSRVIGNRVVSTGLAEGRFSRGIE